MKTILVSLLLSAFSMQAYAENCNRPPNCEHQPGTSRCQERKVYTGNSCPIGGRLGKQFIYERHCVYFDGCGRPTDQNYVEPGNGGGCDGRWED